jgi:hypothetical protein
LTLLQVHSTAQYELALAVDSEIMRKGSLTNSRIMHCDLESIPPSQLLGSGKIIYIVLEELKDPVLMDMRPEQFEGLKQLVSSGSSILWVTGGDLMVGKKPTLAMVHGINTVLMNELSTKNLKFATLDIDDIDSNNTAHHAKWITEVCVSVSTAPSRATCETDFMLKDGIIYVSRVVPDMELNEEFTLDTGAGRIEQEFPSSGNVQLALETPGLLDTVYFREKPTCDIDLEADEIEIQVKAVGLNMKVPLLDSHP